MVSFTFLSFGQAVACLCSTIETAQAGTSVFIPSTFVWGIVFAASADTGVLAMGVLSILCLTRFNQSSLRSLSVGIAPDLTRSGNCPTIQAFLGRVERRSTVVVRGAKYRVKFNERWMACGYLAIFMFGVQFLHSYFFKTSKVVKR